MWTVVNEPNPDIGDRLALLSRAMTNLTDRQVAVAELVAQGLSNASIAARLCLSEGAVRYHLKEIYCRLGVSSRTTLVRCFLLSYQLH